MDIREHLGSSGSLLKATDLKGNSYRMTIDNVTIEDLSTDSSGDWKPVVYFRETKKKFALNSTNGQALAEALGYETDNWAGQVIEVFPSTTDFRGKAVACIRCRAASTPQQQPLGSAPTGAAPQPPTGAPQATPGQQTLAQSFQQPAGTSAVQTQRARQQDQTDEIPF